MSRCACSSRAQCSVRCCSHYVFYYAVACRLLKADVAFHSIRAMSLKSSAPHRRCFARAAYTPCRSSSPSPRASAQSLGACSGRRRFKCCASSRGMVLSSSRWVVPLLRPLSSPLLSSPSSLPFGAPQAKHHYPTAILPPSRALPRLLTLFSYVPQFLLRAFPLGIRPFHSFGNASGGE